MPEELLPVLNTVCALPLLSVVVLVTVNDTVPSSGLTLNVTAAPDTAMLLFSLTVTVNVVLSPGSRGQGLEVITSIIAAIALNGINTQIKKIKIKPTSCFFIVLTPQTSIDSECKEFHRFATQWLMNCKAATLEILPRKMEKIQVARVC